MAGIVATEGADRPDADLLNDQNRMVDEAAGHSTDRPSSC